MRVGPSWSTWATVAPGQGGQNPLPLRRSARGGEGRAGPPGRLLLGCPFPDACLLGGSTSRGGHFQGTHLRRKTFWGGHFQGTCFQGTCFWGSSASGWGGTPGSLLGWGRGTSGVPICGGCMGWEELGCTQGYSGLLRPS